jgi:hypothetical protein
MKAAAEHLWAMQSPQDGLMNILILSLWYADFEISRDQFSCAKASKHRIVEKYWNHERGYRIADILCAFEKLAFRFRSIIHDLDWSAPKSPIRGHIQLQL